MINEALYALGIDGGWKIKNGKIAKWYSEKQQPTQEQIDTKITELQATHDSNKYQRQRAEKYPSWQDQLDNIFHNGIDVWKADLQKIKDQFPKP